jgi:hypothetical protein
MTSTPPTIRNYFAIITRQFRIPNTSIYMSFRAAQDHKVMGRDTTLSTPSSTRREDLVATTRCHSRFCFLSRRSFYFSFAHHELYSRQTCFVYGKLYCGFDDIYVCVMCVLYNVPVLEAPHPRRQPKQAILTDEYNEPRVRRVTRLGPNIFIG